MSDIDVIIVGAGVAGIGAALECVAQGISCQIMEAADRVGGRAYTATAGLDRPWDIGCHWMHSASENQLVAYADRLGATYSKSSGWESSMLWANGKIAEPADVTAAEEATEVAFEAVYNAGLASRDVAIADVLPKASSWARVARHTLQLEVEDDPELASTAAYSDYSDTEEDWPVLSGYGALIERMAEGLDIHLERPVTQLAETDESVRLSTPSGEISAKAVVVTVSTNVLTSGAIHFASERAADFAAKAAHLPCGAFEKVAFCLSRLPQTLGEATHIAVAPPDDGPVLDFKVKDGTPPMIIATIAGGPARALMQMSEAARIAVVQSRLRLALGSEVDALITGAASTNWLLDPLILGSYSHAEPGFGQMRRDMIAEDTGRIGFAGEAFSLHHQATAHGAFVSGRDIAKRLMKRFRLASQ